MKDSAAIAQLQRWLDRHQSHFSLSNADDETHEIQLLKPLGELSLTASIVGRSQRFKKWAEDIQDFVWDQLDRGERLVQLLAARPELLIASTVYGGLRSSARRHDALDRLLKFLPAAAISRAIQFPNWRRLDLEYGLEQLGIDTISPDRMQNMWCARQPEPWAIDTESAYALTHEVFYVTDFGRTPSRLPPRIRRYVHQWLPSWMDLFLSKHNLDLYAELSMAGACIISPREKAVNIGLQTITTAVASYGMLPGPRGGGVGLLGRHRAGSRRKHFITNYHTTLVGLMALVLWESRSGSLTDESSDACENRGP